MGLITPKSGSIPATATKKQRQMQTKEMVDLYLEPGGYGKPHFAHMAPARMWAIIQELDRKPSLKPETRAAVEELAAKFIEWHSRNQF